MFLTQTLPMMEPRDPPRASRDSAFQVATARKGAAMHSAPRRGPLPFSANAARGLAGLLADANIDVGFSPVGEITREAVERARRCVGPHAAPARKELVAVLRPLAALPVDPASCDDDRVCVVGYVSILAGHVRQARQLVRWKKGDSYDPIPVVRESVVQDTDRSGPRGLHEVRFLERSARPLQPVGQGAEAVRP